MNQHTQAQRIQPIQMRCLWNHLDLVRYKKQRCKLLSMKKLKAQRARWMN